MRYAVCNELFGSLSIEEGCGLIRKTGFTGVEFAPFTAFGDFSLAESARGLSRMRSAMAAEGLEFAGFHWLMAKPDGLHLATRDEALRVKSRDHLARLLEAAGTLGGGAMVLGSPKQRKTLPGQSKEETLDLLTKTLSELGPIAEACNSPILLEQLSPDQTDVVNTLEEATALVRKIGSPGVASMFDFHNAQSEEEGWASLIDRYYPYFRHVHVNEVDGRAPGTGKSDYTPAFELLKARGYGGWVSMEIFEIPQDPEACLRGAMEFLSRLDQTNRRSI
jgi:sugar phosphate isomerase/epimerase